MNPVSPRYAEALLSLAASPEEADKAGAVLSDLARALDEIEEFRLLMLSPVVPKSVKRDTAAKLLKDSLPKLAANFFSLLVEKNRTRLLPEILREYDKIKASRRNILPITVFSAEPLDEDLLEAICSKYAKMYGAASVRVETGVDKTLLGGVCVKIGDIRIDDTLSGRLANLRLVLATAQPFYEQG